MAERVRSLLVLVAFVLLLCTAPLPAAAVATLRTAGSGTDPYAPVLALAALTAWTLLGWLLLAAAAALVGRLPGEVGCAAAGLARRIAPAAVRRLIEVSLGLSVTVGGLGATPAFAGSGVPPVPAAPGISLDWPTAATPAPSPALDWPAAPAATAAPARSHPASSNPVVVVQPGDSLWAVAAGHLPAGATDAQVARAWPSWWAANRDVVGPDPDVIHPGLHLTPPARS